MSESGLLSKGANEVAPHIALAKCAVAAHSWFHRLENHEAKHAQALATIMSAMSWTCRVADAEVAKRITTPDRFLTLLSEPVSDWLPDCPDETLVTGCCATDFCQDVIEESGSDPEAEIVQSEVRRIRDRLRERDDGAALYIEFRRFIIENPIIGRRDGPAQLLKFGVEPGKLYTDQVPSLSVIQESGDSVAYPCVRCGWPMQRQEDRLACQYAICRKSGSDFALNAGSSPQPRGGKPLPQGISVGDVAILHRPIWRYTLLPGIAELELYRSLDSLDGVRVKLWPELDRYDLHIETEKRTWCVDVKDWSSATHLAADLNQKEWSQTTWVVVPDHRKHQVQILKERCHQSDVLKFATCSQLVHSVKRSIR